MLVYKCTEVVFVCTQVCTYMYVRKSVLCLYVRNSHCLVDKLPTCLLFTLVLTSDSTLDLCYSGWPWSQADDLELWPPYCWSDPVTSDLCLLLVWPSGRTSAHYNPSLIYIIVITWPNYIITNQCQCLSFIYFNMYNVFLSRSNISIFLSYVITSMLLFFFIILFAVKICENV